MGHWVTAGGGVVVGWMWEGGREGGNGGGGFRLSLGVWTA